MTAEELFNLNAGDINMPETIPCFEEVVKLAVSHNILILKLRSITVRRIGKDV